MAYDLRHFPEFVHPVSSEWGWDVLDCCGDTPEEVDKLVQAALKRGWQVSHQHPGLNGWRHCTVMCRRSLAA